MTTDVEVEVRGTDGFVTRGSNRLSRISRDPRALVSQAMGRTHQYPDGLALFLGTMFVPTADRGSAGAGFTHHAGDIVAISSPLLGMLVNEVGLVDELPPWTMGIRAFWNERGRPCLTRGRGRGVRSADERSPAPHPPDRRRVDRGDALRRDPQPRHSRTRSWRSCPRAPRTTWLPLRRPRGARCPPGRPCPPRRGARVLFRAAAHLLAERAERIGRDLSREEGKTLAEGIGETRRAAAILRYFAGQTSEPVGEVYASATPGTRLYTQRYPVGVVAAITPWNFPIAIPAWKIAPALAYGNTVLFKPAGATPADRAPPGHRAGGCRPAAGRPVAGVRGRRRRPGSVGGDAGPRMRSASPDRSRSVAASAAAAASVHARVQLELGGKNAVIVAPDADIARAADSIVRGAMASAGQKCTATSRVIAIGEVMAPLRAAIVERVTALRAGDPTDPATTLGPLIDGAARDRVAGMVADAEAEGRPSSSPVGRAVGRRVPSGHGAGRGDGRDAPSPRRRCSDRCSPSWPPPTWTRRSGSTTGWRTGCRAPSSRATWPPRSRSSPPPTSGSSTSTARPRAPSRMCRSGA